MPTYILALFWLKIYLSLSDWSFHFQIYNLSLYRQEHFLPCVLEMSSIQVSKVFFRLDDQVFSPLQSDSGHGVRQGRLFDPYRQAEDPFLFCSATCRSTCVKCMFILGFLNCLIPNCLIELLSCLTV
jgi:hypothetical protein